MGEGGRRREEEEEEKAIFGSDDDSNSTNEVMPTFLHTCIHVLALVQGSSVWLNHAPCTHLRCTCLRDEKEGRKKQARSNKQLSKATQHSILLCK